jgi:hypothetical protein
LKEESINLNPRFFAPSTSSDVVDDTNKVPCENLLLMEENLAGF